MRSSNIMVNLLSAAFQFWREQRTIDEDLYKSRHLIENFFSKLKQYWAIATRYDKTA